MRAGTLFFCLGNMLSTVVQRRGVPLLSAVTWGMTYGVAIMGRPAWRGALLRDRTDAQYIISLVALALGASVVAFCAT